MKNLGSTLKKILKIALIAFVIYYVYNQPDDSADAVRDALSTVVDALENGANAVSTFMETLLRRDG